MVQKLDNTYSIFVLSFVAADILSQENNHIF